MWDPDISNSSDFRVSCFKIQLVWESVGVKFKWFANDSLFRFSWFEVQYGFYFPFIWNSVASRFNSFAIELMSDSIMLRFSWCDVHLMWHSIELRFNGFEVWRSKNEVWHQSFSTRLPQVFFCQTSLNNETLNSKFLSFSARFPSKTKLWNSKIKFVCETCFDSKIEFHNSKTKLFCETCFKNGTWKLKTKLLCETSLKKWHVDHTLEVRIPKTF